MKLPDYFEPGPLLGQGGMGFVYRVRDARTGCFLALKVLRSEFLSDAEFIVRLKREAEIAHRIRIEGVARVLEFQVDSPPLFLAYEYVDGDSLANLLHTENFRQAEWVVHFYSKLLTAAAGLHSSGIVHRDLSPLNVLVRRMNGNPVIIDMGISRDLERSAITAPDELLGTPEFCAPERIRGEPDSPSADLYAVGLLIYIGLSGANPFVRDHPTKTLMAQVEWDPPPITSLRLDLPEGWDVFLSRALDKDPVHRYPDAARMIEALQELDFRRESRP